MAQIILLTKVIEVEFLRADGGAEMDQEALMEGLVKVADLINDTTWNEEQRQAFLSLQKVVFFEGVIPVNGYDLDRPCCDEDDRTFYWEANEFTANPDPKVRAHTLFHDCFHIVQYWRNETFAKDDQERIEREVEAIEKQIEVAEHLEAHPSYIQFLVNFKGSQEALDSRFAEGVSKKSDKDGLRIGHDKDKTRPPLVRT